MTKFAVKFTVQGLLVYATMAAYLVAFVLVLVRRKKVGIGAFGVGFAIAVASFSYRWWTVQHVPMQNLFEASLCLAVLMFPLWWFCRRFLRVDGMAADCLIGILLFVFPAGFVFNADPQKLPPALQSWKFVPHVATYLIAYLLLFKAAVQAMGQLIRKAPPDDSGLVSYEQGTYAMVRLGFPLLTVGLVLGAWWGKEAWGDYWHWDPKELWSLVTWLMYVGYLHFRYISGRKRPRTNSALALAGAAAIVITLFWVNLAKIFKGLHSYAA